MHLLYRAFKFSICGLDLAVTHFDCSAFLQKQKIFIKGLSIAARCVSVVSLLKLNLLLQNFLIFVGFAFLNSLFHLLKDKLGIDLFFEVIKGQQLAYCWPQLRIVLQTAENDLSQLFVNGVVVVHVEPVVPRVVNQRLVIGVLVNITFDERRVAFGQDIEHHSQRKNISSFGII